MPATNVSPKWISAWVLCLALLAVPAATTRAGEAEQPAGTSAEFGATTTAVEGPCGPGEIPAPPSFELAASAASVGRTATAEGGERPVCNIECTCDVPASCYLNGVTNYSFHYTTDCPYISVVIFDYGDGHHGEPAYHWYPEVGTYHWTATIFGSD